LPESPRQPHPLLKIVLEIGPLALFLFANGKPKLFAPISGLVLPADLINSEKGGIFTATIMLMIGVLAALLVSRIVMRRWPVMPLVTAVVVVIFGSMTLYFQDQRFIMMKPTFLYVIFGGILLGGLAFNRPLLPYVLDSAFNLTELGWRKLTLRWGIFFFALAGLNEVVRLYYPDYWVSFKAYGIMILTFLFVMTQMPLVLRHEPEKDSADSAPTN